MNFKKFNGSTWETVRHKCYGSGTDSLTAFPAVIQASGEPLTDYLISGDTVQDGTPTPSDPVDVVGCGERTRNLVLVSDNNCITYSTYNKFLINSDSTISITGAALFGFAVKVEPNTQYYATSVSTGNKELRIREYSAKPTDWAADFIVQTTSQPFITSSQTQWILVAFYAQTVQTISNIMLNTGPTALPYEPYGYKIPITVNGTEYPIYLGEAQTTRRIKKLVLTGEETVSAYDYSSQRGARVERVLNTIYRRAQGLCNIYHVATQAGSIGCVWIGSGGGDNNLYFISILDRMSLETVDDFKSYLAAQYAAGTPVTVWYVLAEPETGIVNEPMHKIGNYADTISFAQADVTIPTSDGENTITFGTTVKPSAMSATFKGWHPVQGAKQYDGSEWR